MADAARGAANGRAQGLSCAQKSGGGGRLFRRTSARLLRAGLLAGAGLLALAPVYADETITYSYDARGRLQQVTHAGTVNNGVTANYQLDPADNRITLTVTTAALPTLSIGGGSATEGGSITFTVNRSSSTGSSSVNYATTDGTAHTGTDYTGTSGTLNFVAGDTSKTFIVSTIDNAVVDGTRTFSANLSSATGATIATAQATGTINDNDSAPSLSISGGTVTEGGQIIFTVTRSTGTGTSSVSYATADGTAHTGTDYTGTSGTLNFAAGQTSLTFTVSTTDNAVVDGTRTFSANLSNATGATIGTSQATGTINDNDSAPSLSISGGTVTERWPDHLHRHAKHRHRHQFGQLCNHRRHGACGDGLYRHVGHAELRGGPDLPTVHGVDEQRHYRQWDEEFHGQSLERERCLDRHRPGDGHDQ